MSVTDRLTNEKTTAALAQIVKEAREKGYKQVRVYIETDDRELSDEQWARELVRRQHI